MSLIEIALVALLAVRAAASAMPSRLARLIPSLAAGLAVVAHLVVDGWRWQMIPVYVVAAAMAVWDLVRPVRDSHPVGAGLALLGIGVVAAPPFMLPVPEFPPLTGPDNVGTVRIEATDGVRERTLPLQIWYPAETGTDTDDGPRASWLEDMDTRLPLLASDAGLPSWFLSHARSLSSHAVVNAPIVDRNDLPVIVFSHGRGGFKEQNTFMAEGLAARGLVVVAVDHPGGAFATVLDDGTTIEFDDDLFGADLDGEAFDEAIRTVGRTWADDLSAVLDRLSDDSTWDSAQRLDTAEVVAVGHSTGGGAAFEFCSSDNRCRGAVGLDPWLLPTSEQTLDDGIDQPIYGLFGDASYDFFSTENHVRFDRLLRAGEQRGATTRYDMVVGADHVDFTDGALLSPWGRLFGQPKGSIDADRAYQIIVDEIAHFTDAALGEVSHTPPSTPEVVPWPGGEEGLGPNE